MTKRLPLVLALFALVFALSACSDGSKEVAGAWVSDELHRSGKPRTLWIEGKTLVRDGNVDSNVGYSREGDKIVIQGPGSYSKYIVTVLDKDTIRVRCDYFRFECNYTRTTPEELERIHAPK